MKSKKGKKIYAFRGIPYAKPPVGSRRFRRSELFGPWKGTLNGAKESKKAFQPNVLMPKSPFIEGGEDCLYLNVYTKRLNQSVDGPLLQEEEDLFPVVVFLHGGAFVVGSCESMLYGPQVLLDRDIVLVGVNYRLGPFGWLSLENDEAPGNLGLHDQHLALLWVKENIEAFGGDPENVTLMGESAGAMSAMCHLVSPKSEGLFHKIIALSGPPSSTLLTNSRRPLNYALALAEKLGYDGQGDPADVLEFLQQQKAKDILKQSIMFLDWDYAHPMPWVPVNDSYAKDPFLPETFENAVSSGNFNKVPVVMGVCKDEGLILSAPFYKNNKRWKVLRENWQGWAPLLFLNKERDLQTSIDEDIAKEIGEFYFGANVDVSELEGDDENLSKLTDMFSMAYFHAGFDEDSKLLAKSGVDVFTFMLTHPPDFTLMDIFRLSLSQLSLMFTCRSLGFNPYKKELGVCHGDILSYLFPMNAPGFPKAVVSSQQVEVQTRLLDFVSSFAMTSQPFFDGVQKDIWKKLNAEVGEYLNLGVGLKMERNLDFSKGLEFWKKIRLTQMKAILSNEPISILHDKIAVER